MIKWKSSRRKLSNPWLLLWIGRSVIEQFSKINFLKAGKWTKKKKNHQQISIHTKYIQVFFKWRVICSQQEYAREYMLHSRTQRIVYIFIFQYNLLKFVIAFVIP